MKVWLIDDVCGYYLLEEPGLGTEVEVTQEFWERYLAYESELEYIQSKLHRIKVPLDQINNLT
jgi:hypothetical protein